MQSSVSSHNLSSLPLQIWLLLTLSHGLSTSPFSPLPLPSTYISSTPALLVPSPISPVAPLPSCVRGHILLNLSSTLLLLKPLAIHRNTERRASSLIRSFRLASNAGWMPSSTLPASTRDLNWYKKHFGLQKIETLEHYLLHHSFLHSNSSASSISRKLPRFPH